MISIRPLTVTASLVLAILSGMVAEGTTATTNSVSAATTAAATSTSTSTKPNIVFILCDDVSTKLDSAAHMPKLKANVIDKGMTIANSFVATPVCCPSRSEIYTGKYIHNIGVFNNSAGPGGCSSLEWHYGPERNSIAYYLKSIQGYATSFSGKYMNNYGSGKNKKSSLPDCLNETYARLSSGMENICAQDLSVPRGWDNWQALKGNSVYYNYTLSNNGVEELHNDTYEVDYLTDLVKNRSIAFMEEQAGVNPFFLVAAVPAAHEPSDPAPQYANYAEGLVAPRTPNFNVVMSDDARHWMVANVNIDGSPMNDTVISFVDLLYRRRLATLQSVDDLVEAFTTTLTNTGVIDNTYIIFTADNGYHLGQFAIGLDKRQPYETDVRVPMYIRGPGIAEGSVQSNGFVVNIDLAPTFLAMAGMSTDDIDALGMDGEPITPLLFNALSTDGSAETMDAFSRTDFLIEYYGEAWDGCTAYLNNTFDNIYLDKIYDGVDCGTRGPTSFKTEPLWDGTETWSSIQDSGNNTYSCVRSVNSTSDLQYCEWVSGEVEYFDVQADDWQMKNLAPTMDPALQASFHARLEQLKACGGRKQCHNIKQ